MSNPSLYGGRNESSDSCFSFTHMVLSLNRMSSERRMQVMTKQNAQFYGTLAGIIPALWVGAYLIHLVPIELARFQWWGLPWYATVLAIVALIPALFAWYFGWMVEDD